jgi:signal peptidase I
MTTGPRRVPGATRAAGLRARLAGPWRVDVAEVSMTPAIDPGDWLLVDPTVARWPRRGTVVVFREPGSGELAIKRVAGRPGDWVPFAGGYLPLAEDAPWLLSDATDDAVTSAGFGRAVDSRAYGPVSVDALVARPWLRYWPLRRLGRIGRSEWTGGDGKGGELVGERPLVEDDRGRQG